MVSVVSFASVNGMVFTAEKAVENTVYDTFDDAEKVLGEFKSVKDLTVVDVESTVKSVDAEIVRYLSGVESFLHMLESNKGNFTDFVSKVLEVYNSVLKDVQSNDALSKDLDKVIKSVASYTQEIESGDVSEDRVVNFAKGLLAFAFNGVDEDKMLDMQLRSTFKSVKSIVESQDALMEDIGKDVMKGEKDYKITTNLGYNLHQTGFLLMSVGMNLSTKKTTKSFKDLSEIVKKNPVVQEYSSNAGRRLSSLAKAGKHLVHDLAGKYSSHE